jgi:hypothetical protein
MRSADFIQMWTGGINTRRQFWTLELKKGGMKTDSSKSDSLNGAEYTIGESIHAFYPYTCDG